MKNKRISGVIAVTAASALVLSGCASGATDIVEGSSVTIAWNEGFYSANSSTTNGNNVVNANVAYLANSSFNYYDSETNLIKNEQFGKYELLSTEPVTVKYTVNSGVKWSDGADVNASDMLLSWAANSCNFNNVEPVLDEDTGEVTNQEELDAGVLFDSAACGTDIGYVTETPVISDGGRSITLVYDEPVIDWELAFGIGVPAHVTTQVAFPGEELTDEAAQQKLIDAINNKDLAVLAPISKAWSTAYDMENTPENMDLLVSNGAYTVTELVEQEYVTLTANPAYSWGPSPKVQKITIRIIEDPKAAVQSLANGEVDVIAPQATADILLDLATYEDRGVVVDVKDEAAYEHIDLTFDREGGPFNPATYDGDAEKAQKVRAAFLMTIPREDIIEKLIAPINPNAVLMNSLTQLPSFAWYDDIVAENGSENLAFDIEGAKALLEEAGVSTPVRVEMMFNGSNPRRVSQFTLIQESAALAGFNVVDESVPTGWGSKLGDGTYDATLFAWGFTSTSFVSSKAQFTTTGANNYGKYSNPEVDALYEKLSVELDPEVQKSLLLEVEKFLWADAFGTTVFQFPSVVAYNSNKIKGIVQAPLVPGIFWNFWEWEQVSEVVEG